MRIGILLHPYDEDKPAGLARTIFELSKGMLEVDRDNEYVIFVKNKPRKDPELPGNWKLHVLGGGLLWLDKMRFAESLDVYIFNTPVMPFFWRPSKSVVIALDFAYWYLAERTLKSQLRKIITFLFHRRALRRADAIVAISNATKEETIKLFNIAEEKISVVWCGFKKICTVEEARIPLPSKFFFFVGIIKPRKNVFNIVKAFRHFYTVNKEYSLVIAGNGNGEYYESICKYIKENNLEKAVVWAGHLGDGELSYIYKRAEALVFPTLIEGFGYPVLEAMDCGVPVITSNQSSLKEIGGDSALLVDPYGPQSIAKAMRVIVEKPEERERLVRDGVVWSKQFSWHKAASELLTVIRTINN